MLSSLSGKKVTGFVELGRTMMAAPTGLAPRRAIGRVLLDLFAADQWARR
jgi:hypothetical protein